MSNAVRLIVLTVVVALTGCATTVTTVSRRYLQIQLADMGSHWFPVGVNDGYYLGNKDGFHYFRYVHQDQPQRADGSIHTLTHLYRVAAGEPDIFEPFAYDGHERMMMSVSELDHPLAKP